MPSLSFAALKIKIDSDNQVTRKKIKTNIQKDLSKYAGTYSIAVKTGTDDGFDQEILISVEGSKPSATYLWRSWNDSPAANPQKAVMTDVNIKGPHFTGKQSIYGSGGKIEGDFVKVYLNGEWIFGFLQEGESFWKKE